MTTLKLTRSQRKHARLAPFAAWVGIVLVLWLVVVTAYDLWPTVAGNWRIALTMLIGSYVAGSTPLGGGTVAFPILVLMFDEPATLGRTFSFAIQAIGMTSASIYILASGQRLVPRVLIWAIVGSSAALPIVAGGVAPFVADATIKLVFACVWGGFGLMTLVKLRDLLTPHPPARIPHRFDIAIGLSVGFLGAIAAGLTGAGIDMVIYAVLVLLYRADVRAAVATSVVLMAYNSLLGAIVSAATGAMDASLFAYWIAAVPVVLFGAPIGALMLTIIPRDKTMLIVAALCVLQLLWTGIELRLGVVGWFGVVIAVLAMNAAFHLLYVQGVHRMPRNRAIGNGQ